MTQKPANPDHIDDTIDGHQNIAEHDRQCKVNDLFGNVAFRKILHGFLVLFQEAAAMKNIDTCIYSRFRH